MPGMGLGGTGGGPHGQTTRVDRRYSITLSAFAHNIFNVVNLAPPNGTLGGRRTAPPTRLSSASRTSWHPAFSPTAPPYGTSIFRRGSTFKAVSQLLWLHKGREE